MGKIINIFILAFLFFSIFMLLPKQIKAATINPDPIGDLQPGEKRPVTISGLSANKKYFWKEEKLTSTFPISSYSTIFFECYIADSNNQIKKEFGPFSTPGLYQFTLTNTPTNGKCEPTGNSIIGPKDFSVGGPTNQSCCEFTYPTYDKNKDRCKSSPISAPIPILPNLEKETVCTTSKPVTFCEPDSLKCFEKKTTLVGGKTCFDPALGKSFDSGKNVYCAKAGGLPCDPAKPNNPGIKTAIGCIHTNPADLMQDVLKFGVGIGGGLAFLMMLLGAFQMLTSAGNPETLQAGRDRLTSAVIGLLVIIFSVLLLQIIGVDILGIAGFGR